jgi:hypothetical protein
MPDSVITVLLVVRDRAFTARITSNADTADHGVLRDRALKIAEQVAGFLFLKECGRPRRRNRAAGV